SLRLPAARNSEGVDKIRVRAAPGLHAHPPRFWTVPRPALLEADRSLGRPARRGTDAPPAGWSCRSGRGSHEFRAACGCNVGRRESICFIHTLSELVNESTPRLGGGGL